MLSECEADEERTSGGHQATPDFRPFGCGLTMNADVEEPRWR
jgi:hypothetical protein